MLHVAIGTTFKLCGSLEYVDVMTLDVGLKRITVRCWNACTFDRTLDQCIYMYTAVGQAV